MLDSVWNSIGPFQTQLIGLAVTLVGLYIAWLFRARVKLIYGRANNSLNQVRVPDPQDSQRDTFTEIYVEKFFLQNIGRKPATEVAFVLSNFPTDINIYQPRQVEFVSVGKGDCMIKIPKIAPSELVIIDCVYINMQAAFITSVKCSEALGKEVPFQTIRQFPKFVYIILLILMAFGISFVVQALASIF